MFALPRPFRTTESPSSDLPSARLGPRAGTSRTPPEGGEVTRRVSLPVSLDRAIEARREVTSESRDEAIVFLLRSALRGTEEGEAPPWASALMSALEALGPRAAATSQGVPHAALDTGELASTLLRLSEIATHHRSWLDAHHAALDETHRATGAAVEDLKGFATTAAQVNAALTGLRASVERTAAAEQEIIAQSMTEATRATQAQLDAARAQVEAARAQMEEFQEAHETHVSGLRGHIERYRRMLRLTPTVAVSIVAVAAALGLVTSVVFVPTYQKFTEEKFVQTQVAPVVREEIGKAFAVLRAENEKKAKEFFELEHDRFEKFAAHYRAQIESLRDSKATMAVQIQTLRGVNSEAREETEKWKNVAKALEKENTHSKTSVIERFWNSVTPLQRLFLGVVAFALLLLVARWIGGRR